MQYGVKIGVPLALPVLSRPGRHVVEFRCFAAKYSHNADRFSFNSISSCGAILIERPTGPNKKMQPSFGWAAHPSEIQ